LKNILTKLEDLMSESNLTEFSFAERLRNNKNSDKILLFGLTNGEKELFNRLKEYEIAQYLKDSVNGTVSSKRIKLLTVGNTRHGKTSLLYYLKRGESLGPTTNSTDGIDIDEWKVSNDMQDEISISR
jgi:hypothetical protein